MHRSAALVLLLFCISAFAEAAELCAFPGRDGDRQLRGEVNRWLPSPDNAVLEPGARTITVAAEWRGRGALQSGDLLLLIQMQGADIETANNSAYGAVSVDGAGTGDVAVGHFEFVRLESVQDLTLQVRGAGANGGISRRYISRDPREPDKGVARWQVVRVPQFENLTLSDDLLALPWNGRSGGVLALDVRRELRLNGFTLNAHGGGFRGGAALSLTGALGDEHDYRYRAPSNSELAVGFGQHGSKGEGIAGTPRWVAVEHLDTAVNGDTDASAAVAKWRVLDTRPQAEKSSRSDGYPDGSMAKGAPGNAGGGGSSLSADNKQSSGGGGGAGGERGSAGRDSANKPRGGLGGAAVSAENARLIAGGGGGAGTRRKGIGGNGGAGGGIVFVRAGILNGPGKIDVSGAAGERSVDAGAGGGGGGGSLWIQSAFGDSAEIVLSLDGGRGGLGSAPGGSGGDGRVLFGGGVTIQAPAAITNDRLMRDSVEGAAAGYVCRPSGMLISGTLFEDNGAVSSRDEPSRRAQKGSVDAGIAHDGRRQRYEKALQGWPVSVQTPEGELVAQTTTSVSGQFSLELSEQWAGKALVLLVSIKPRWHAVVAKANDLPMAPFVYEGKGRWAFNAQKEYLQDGLVLGLVRQPDIEAPALRTVQPSSTQLFLFRYTPHTQSRARFRYRGELSGASNWTHAFFLDPDCDNTSDYVDKYITGWVPVQAEQPVCVRVRVDVPKGASQTGVFSMQIDAETQLENTPLNLQFAPIKAAIDVSLPR